MDLQSLIKSSSKWVAVILSLIGAMAAILTTIVATKVKDQTNNLIANRVDSQIEKRISRIEHEISRIQDIAKAVQTNIGPTGPGGGTSEASQIKIAGLERDLGSLQQEVKQFKQLVLNEPEQALTLPLIKKDVELLQETDKQIRTDIANMAGLGKWFIGSLITIALGLFSLVITMVIKGKEKP